MNQLFFGDCLDVLRELEREHKGGFIDLIYIDPPFNSKRNYNVLFESIDLKDATAQKQAFADTWSNVSYIDTIKELATLDKDLHEFLTTLSKIRTSDSAVAYLSTMAIRIHYMHRLLKDTGSFYLHCDSTMSHYLKIVCDLIFGEKNFRNEISWKRSYGHGDSTRSLGRSHDSILFYNKSSNFVLNKFYHAHSEKYLKDFFKHNDERGVYKLENLTSPNPRPNLKYEYKGYPSPEKGWRVNMEKMIALDKEGRLHFPKSKDGRIMKKVYLHELGGQPMTDFWDDIKLLSAHDDERLGYPTQKPEVLMERIISASSNEGDLVADFFCGCGTTIAAAQKLNRNWIGADISHLAIRLISKRLVETYGKGIRHNFEIKGFPRDIGSARELSLGKDGRFEFQDWVVEVLLNGVLNTKKTGDGGWDGYLTFDMPDKKEFAIIEVKSGGVTVKNIREFIQVVEKQKAGIGIFVCFGDEVTQPMLKEAKQAGYFREDMWPTTYPRIQIITIEELLNHAEPKLPNVQTTFKKAQRNEGKASKGLFD